MQRAEDSSSRLAPEPVSPRSGLKPTTAFVLLLLVIATIGALVFLTRPTPAPQPTGTTTATEPSFALTNEEAIARFEELNARLNNAYSERDRSLLATIYTNDSQALSVAEEEIQRLIQDGVFDRSTYDTLSVEVVGNGPTEVTLRERVAINTRFESEDGENLTKGPSRSLQVVLWTLRLQGTEWLVHDGVIKRSQLDA